MLHKVFNFCAGPAAMPQEVMYKAQQEFRNYHGTQVSLLEMSHRSNLFDEVIKKAEANVRFLMDIPDEYGVFFIQGGASFQFAMLAMNLLPPIGKADYIDTGRWSQKAIEQAKLIGNVNVIASGKDIGYTAIPQVDELIIDPGAAYLHFTSNNTVYGTQFHEFPDYGNNVPLVCDMSSDIMSREVDVEKFAMIYAGLQKNLGPSGMSLVIMRPDMIEKSYRVLPDLLKYSTYDHYHNLYNTPNSFAVYMLSLVTDWIREQGGVGIVERINDVKSEILYEEIDRSEGFYNGFAFAPDRSRMNVCFNLPTTELDQKFVAEAAEKGMVGLAGHRSVGGIRASIYNAMPLKGVSRLIDFMTDFKKKNS